MNLRKTLVLTDISVGDFGLAAVRHNKQNKSLYQSRIFDLNEPVSHKLDVLMFGSVLCELFTQKHLPIVHHLENLQRLQKANLPGTSFVNMLVKCCDKTPANRPTMAEILQEIQQIRNSTKEWSDHENTFQMVANNVELVGGESELGYEDI